MNSERQEARVLAAKDAMRIIYEDEAEDFDRDPLLWNARSALAAADEAEASELMAVRSVLRSLVDANVAFFGNEPESDYPGLNAAVLEAKAALDGLSETPEAERGA